ncbi:MAG: NUDIX domain-containing protein [Vallitaleaceae bacterium]|jgi:8-oxo-dGTP pyrophosphatase MutT (NUDIX family)|nr:NUDIX domain-containing protein [Vallitaleaceae bacterium]
MFNKVFGMLTRENYVDVLTRVAVRAVISKDNKVLMIHNNKGDYKFPGGGIETGESHQETLEREVREESGYSIQGSTCLMGSVIERRIDQLDCDRLFEMESFYYSCQIGDTQEEQMLDAYEEDLEMKPMWVTLDEAITNNENLRHENTNHWIERELYVLKVLRDKDKDKD